MREEKKRERRERIISAASRLFRRFGYRRTSLEDIAREAGLGKATLYHYVSGKDALFGEMIQRAHHDYKVRLEAALAQEKTPVDKLYRYAGEVLAFHREATSDSVLTPEEKREQFPEMFKHIVRFADTEREWIGRIVQEGVDEGMFRPVDAARISTLLFAAFRGMIAEECRSPGGSDGVIGEFLDVLFSGLLTPAHRAAFESRDSEDVFHG